MKIKRLKSAGAKRKNHFFCGRCGLAIPMQRKWFTKFTFAKIKKLKKWIVFVSYVCPQCLNATDVTYATSYLTEPQAHRKFLKLYNQKP